MIHRLSVRAADYFSEGTDADREIVAYGIECRVSDVVQVVVLLMAGWVLRCTAAMLSFSFCFSVLKRQIGGWHCKTHLTCIGGFTLLMLISVHLSAIVPAEYAVAVALACTALTAGVVIRYAPVAHPNHPKSSAAHERSRKIGIRLAVAGAALLPILSMAIPTIGVAGALGCLSAAGSLVIPNKERG